MSQAIFKVGRWLLPVLLVSALSGCVAYQPLPAGSYVVNADGTRTYVSNAYACPAGYTCTYPVADGVTTPAATTTYYAPYYYPYPSSYVAPAPYIWPPLFFGLGYYWGGHYHHGGYHHPRR